MGRNRGVPHYGNGRESPHTLQDPRELGGRGGRLPNAYKQIPKFDTHRCALDTQFLFRSDRPVSRCCAVVSHGTKGYRSGSTTSLWRTRSNSAPSGKRRWSPRGWMR